jgi:hypothetical protein
MNDTFINGPVNIIRLEGKINNLKKVIYLFGDIHLSICRSQNRCESENRIDIDQFLSKTFSENKKIQYDLFIEAPKTQLLMKCNNSMKNYISNMRNFIRKNFIISKNNVINSPNIKNVRFHYFDIRNYFDDFFIIKDRIDSYIHNSLEWYYDIEVNIKILLNELDQLKYELNKIIILLESKNNKEINKITDKKNYKNIKIYKIVLEKYNIILENIKNINIDKHKYEITKELDKHIKSNNITNYEFSFTIFKQINELNKFLENEFSKLIDLYLIRRILDKEYVSTSLVYTGYYHLADIIHILMNEFNFKITHSTFNNDDLIKVNKIVKKNNSEFINFLLKNISVNLYVTQCSNFKNFPKDMS